MSGQVFLDHVAWMVPELEPAAAALERLGFPLTPPSIHADRDESTGVRRPVGTANRLAVLERGYLEILTPYGNVDTPVTRHMKRALAHHIGVHLIALRVCDAQREAAEIVRRGIEVLPTVHLRRDAEAEDGRQVELSFTVVRAALHQFPEARVQMLTHHTPEHLWQSRYLPEANAITELLEATIITIDPREAAGRFARFAGRPVAACDGMPSIRLDQGCLRFADPRTAAESFGRTTRPPLPAVGAITLASRDLDQTRDFLLGQGLRPGAIAPDQLLIDESEAMGVHIVIVPSGKAGDA